MNEVTREILISARRDTVFRFFTDSARFAAWWGEGSRIDPRPGGAVLIQYPGGTTASGVVKEIEPPVRIVFSYGYDSGKPIPAGASSVIVSLAETAHGTRVTLRHTDLPNAEVAREHVQGWRYQLALFAKAVCVVEHAEVGQVVDRWFAAWGELDADKRVALLSDCATPEVTFRDDFGATVGLDELSQHIAAVHRHMPGTRIARAGEVKQCQGAALVRWQATAEDGRTLGGGANAIELAPDGRIRSLVGFWGA
jgi:uncharacterized protein YndB with AHSA1/START domain